MPGPKPTDTLTETRLDGMLYLYRNASKFAPAPAGRAYGNAFSQFTGGYIYAWPGSTRKYALTDKGREVVEWLLALRDEKRQAGRSPTGSVSQAFCVLPRRPSTTSTGGTND
jgi:hypothetical protein